MGNLNARSPAFSSETALAILVAVALSLTTLGCQTGRDEVVRDKDRQRQETARIMQGNDVPPDHADLGDRAPTDPALDQGDR